MVSIKPREKLSSRKIFCCSFNGHHCDQCGGSGMFIPDSGSQILIFTHSRSRIQDPKTATKDRGEIFFSNHFCSHKFHKTEYYFIFDMLKKESWPNFPRIIEVFTQKIVTKPSKIWVWDPRSGIRKKPIPDPGSRGQH